MQHEKELFTLRFNRMNSVRVEPHGWSKVLCHLNSNLSYLQSIFVQPAHNKMLDRADTTKLVEEKETPATKHSHPQKWRPNTARLSRTRLKRRRAHSKLTTLPTNGLWGGQANGNRPRTRTAWLADPFILDSLGSGMDGTNQKCKSRKRSRETDRSATTRTRVGGVLSVSYHSCSGKDPLLSKGLPTARITVAKPPFTQWIALILFQSTKWEIRKKEKKEVFIEEALHLK